MRTNETAKVNFSTTAQFFPACEELTRELGQLLASGLDIVAPVEDVVFLLTTHHSNPVLKLTAQHPALQGAVAFEQVQGMGQNAAVVPDQPDISVLRQRYRAQV